MDKSDEKEVNIRYSPCLLIIFYSEPANPNWIFSLPAVKDLSQEGVTVAAIANFRFGIFLSESPKDL
jgi:hypothetical protein